MVRTEEEAKALHRSGDIEGCIDILCSEDFECRLSCFPCDLAQELLEKTRQHELFVKLVEGCPVLQESLDYRDNYWVFVASENGYIEPLEALLKFKIVDPSANDQAALRAACEGGHVRAVEILLAHKRGGKPSFNGGEALLRAVLKGREEVVRCLLKHGGLATVLKTGRPLEAAAQEGHDALVQLFLQDESHGGVAVEARGQAALRSAASHGHTNSLKLILAHEKANPGAKDGEALVAAAARGHTGCVEVLCGDARASANGAGQQAYKEARERGSMAMQIVLAKELGMAGTVGAAKKKNPDDKAEGSKVEEKAAEEGGAAKAAKEEEAQAKPAPKKKAKRRR